MKNTQILYILVALIVVIGIFTGITYTKNTSLTKEISNLNAEKSALISERESLRSENDGLKDDLKMLEEDVREIYKGCIKDNACKGRYPGVRWFCNNVGDEVSDPSHTCKCDSSCNLVATEIKS